MAQPERDVSRFSLGGITLVLLGVLFLLQTLGVVSWAVWGVLWRFWPVVLILIGINILWGRRSPWLMPVVTGVALLGVIGAAVLIQDFRPPGAATTFSQPLMGAVRAEVEIDFGAGELLLTSLPATTASLAEGAGNPGVEQDFQLQGDTGLLRLSVPGRGPFWAIGERGFRMEAALNPNIPLELRIRTGASDAQVDLSGLRVTRLRVETGASRFHLRLPAGAGDTDVGIKAGAAQVTITIPQGVAARISEDTGVGSFSIDESRFPKAGGVYESPDFATAANRVELHVESGVASVEVR